MNRHPLRRLFEKFGLVRTEAEQVERFKEADEAADEGLKVAREAKRRREALTLELQSYRRPERRR